MSLATILKKIDDEAEAYAQKLIEQARTEGDKILAYNRAEAKQEAAQVHRQAELELQNFTNKQKATALLQVRKDKLDHRQCLLNEVYVQTLTRILACPNDQYKAIVKQILLSVEEERPATIRVAATDHGVITKKFIDEVNVELSRQKRALHFQLATQPVDIRKGCIVDFDEFEMNFAFETLLAGIWTSLKAEASRQLFGDGNQ
jgi:V/A-type H+/Na+-transporting ATPase subunit E